MEEGFDAVVGRATVFAEETALLVIVVEDHVGAVGEGGLLLAGRRKAFSDEKEIDFAKTALASVVGGRPAIAEAESGSQIGSKRLGIHVWMEV